MNTMSRTEVKILAGLLMFAGIIIVLGVRHAQKTLNATKEQETEQTVVTTNTYFAVTNEEDDAGMVDQWSVEGHLYLGFTNGVVHAGHCPCWKAGRAELEDLMEAARPGDTLMLQNARRVAETNAGVVSNALNAYSKAIQIDAEENQ